MALNVSTGMRNQLLITNPLTTVLNLGFIKIYDGVPPGDADAALGSAGTNNLLVTISVASGGTGLTFSATAVSGALAKNSAETWSGLIGATGTATFYRHTAVGDTGASSTTEARLQGDIDVANAEMNLANTTLTSSNTQTISSYSVSLPPA